MQDTPPSCECSLQGHHCERDLIVKEDTLWGCRSTPFPRQPNFLIGLHDKMAGIEAVCVQSLDVNCPHQG